MKVEEEALRQRIAEAALRDAAEATAKAAARLAQHFEGMEARLQDAKALAAACCEPPLTPAEKVLGPCQHVRCWSPCEHEAEACTLRAAARCWHLQSLCMEHCGIGAHNGTKSTSCWTREPFGGMGWRAGGRAAGMVAGLRAVGPVLLWDPKLAARALVGLWGHIQPEMNRVCHGRASWRWRWTRCRRSSSSGPWPWHWRGTRASRRRRARLATWRSSWAAWARSACASCSTLWPPAPSPAGRPPSGRACTSALVRPQDGWSAVLPNWCIFHSWGMFL